MLPLPTKHHPKHGTNSVSGPAQGAFAMFSVKTGQPEEDVVLSGRPPPPAMLRCPCPRRASRCPQWVGQAEWMCRCVRFQRPTTQDYLPLDQDPSTNGYIKKETALLVFQVLFELGQHAWSPAPPSSPGPGAGGLDHRLAGAVRSLLCLSRRWCGVAFQWVNPG